MTRRSRSRIHMLTAALREAAKDEATARAEGRAQTAEDEQRIARQRTLFTMLPDYEATRRLKATMMQRVYDLMWDGDTSGADALLEFLPSADAGHILDAWEKDWGDGEPKSPWHHKG